MLPSTSTQSAGRRKARPYVSVPQVLVAEDDDDLREMLRDQLLALGLLVSVVADGAALSREVELALQDQAGFDLVITDIRLPGASGLDALTALREGDAATPVVVISAFLGPDEADAALRLGANAVLAKPFEASELKATVEMLLGPRRGG